jgi:hypothetical protein
MQYLRRAGESRLVPYMVVYELNRSIAFAAGSLLG